MDFKQIKLDGIDILQTGIIYTYVNWKKLVVNDESRDIEGVHGRITSPVYARYRIITIEGVLDRVSGSENEKITHLQNLFSLQNDLSNLDNRLLYIKDSFDNEWSIGVKIKEPIDFIEGDDSMTGSYWKWRVVLESTKEPIYKSFEELFINGEEGDFGGFFLDLELGEAWDEVSEIIEINTLSTKTYTRFELDIIGEINPPLKIENITNKTFFALDVHATTGDKIIIDSEKYIVTKNGENIIGNRLPGSIWQRISGINQFIVSDQDGNIFEKDLNLKIYYRNALL